MDLFKRKERAAHEAVRKQAMEEIYRREFCVEQAALVCDERPADLIRVAEQIYEWVYGRRERAS